MKNVKFILMSVAIICLLQVFLSSRICAGESKNFVGKCVILGHEKDIFIFVDKYNNSSQNFDSYLDAAYILQTEENQNNVDVIVIEICEIRVISSLLIISNENNTYIFKLYDDKAEMQKPEPYRIFSGYGLSEIDINKRRININDISTQTKSKTTITDLIKTLNINCAACNSGGVGCIKCAHSFFKQEIILGKENAIGYNCSSNCNSSYYACCNENSCGCCKDTKSPEVDKNEITINLNPVKNEITIKIPKENNQTIRSIKIFNYATAQKEIEKYGIDSTEVTLDIKMLKIGYHVISCELGGYTKNIIFVKE